MVVVANVASRWRQILSSQYFQACPSFWDIVFFFHHRMIMFMLQSLLAFLVPCFFQLFFSGRGHCILKSVFVSAAGDDQRPSSALCRAQTPAFCQRLRAVGEPWKSGLLLCVHCVVELIVQDFSIGRNRRFSLLVKIPAEERERDGL